MSSTPAQKFNAAAKRSKPGPASIGWHRLAEIALVILLAWLVARLVLGLLAPLADVQPGRLGPGPEGNSPAINAAVFSRFDPFVGHAPAPDAKPQIRQVTTQTTLNLTLFGVWPDGDGQGSAIIGTATGGQNVYRVKQGASQEEIMAGVGLAQVHGDHVIITRAGVLESLYMPERLSASRPAQAMVQKGRRNAAGTIDTIDTQLPDNLDIVDMVDAITSYFSLEPSFTNEGVFIGYAVYPASDAGVFARVGLVEGDIITAINGRPAPNQPEALIDLLGGMTPNDSLRLTLSRGGAVTDVSFRMTDLIK